MSAFFILLILVSLACFFSLFHFRHPFASFLNDLFSVGEDFWTWTSQAGDLFEDVELESVKSGELTFSHKFGRCSIPIQALSENTRRLLYRTQFWQEHTGTAPVQAKGEALLQAPAHAAHAA